MKIYLVRHGDAVDAQDDSQRPLSKKGMQEVQKTADFLALHEIDISQIYHSEKLRAQQTAELIAQKLKTTPKIQVLAGLLPDDPVKPIAVYCNHWQQDVMLVGHLPFMAKLVSELLFDKDDRQCIDFQTASVLCLERIAIFHWCIAWFNHPSLIEK